MFTPTTIMGSYESIYTWKVAKIKLTTFHLQLVVLVWPHTTTCIVNVNQGSHLIRAIESSLKLFFAQ